MKTGFLIIIATFLVLLPWFQGINVGFNNEVMVDGITVSAIIVMTITLVSSLATWCALSWATKNIRLHGILLAIISGSSIILPFLQVLGPMAAIMVGITGGFAAFMLQKKMLDPAKNRPVVISGITFAAAYFALTILVLSAQSSHIWDTGDGIGAWEGTPEGIEEKEFDNILANNIKFGFFFVIIPSLIATGLITRTRKMRTSFIGMLLVIIGSVALSMTIPAHYYISDVILAPTEPPTMKSLEGIDRFLIENSFYFSFVNIISIVIIPLGAIIVLLSRRKRK